MGYSTSFEGQFTFDKPLSAKHLAYLIKFANERHESKKYADVPSIFCQWVPNEDGTALRWDGNEKFQEYTKWLDFLIAHFIAPWGYVLNGVVTWECREDSLSTGTITVSDNYVKTVENEHSITDNNQTLQHEQHGKKNMDAQELARKMHTIGAMAQAAFDLDKHEDIMDALQAAKDQGYELQNELDKHGIELTVEWSTSYSQFILLEKVY